LFQNGRQTHPVIRHHFAVSNPGFAAMKYLHHREDTGNIPCLDYFPYFEKEIRGGLCDHLAVCSSPLIFVRFL
jgi:hypothetical protein